MASITAPMSEITPHPEGVSVSPAASASCVAQRRCCATEAGIIYPRLISYLRSVVKFVLAPPCFLSGQSALSALIGLLVFVAVLSVLETEHGIKQRLCHKLQVSVCFFKDCKWS
jgi:hypothetical protein